MAARDLFGGAMSMAIPADMLDVSDFRQVPDNQEVFVTPGSSDQSIIVEILELTDKLQQEAVKYHFELLAEVNDSQSSEVLDVGNLAVGCVREAYVLLGRQRVAKFNEVNKGAFNTVYILMALLRIPEHAADILITLNVPVEIDRKSSSSNASEGQLPVDSAKAFAEFKKAVGTFKINDLGLFG
ncbi:hypothetical protein GGI12_001774 [Dipsacomyces acuminosporus]|nr:hypothetical protein GGI12_001774 [Dipsacomyces acuminosporus]